MLTVASNRNFESFLRVYMQLMFAAKRRKISEVHLKKAVIVDR